MPDDFNTNQQGLLSASQQKLLWFSAARWIPQYALVGAAVTIAAFQANQMLGLIMLGFTCVAILGNIFIHLSDVWLMPTPKHISGVIYKKNLRSQWSYGWIRIAKEELRCQPKMWTELRDNEVYEVFYAAKTKWLLSYRFLAQDNITTMYTANTILSESA